VIALVTLALALPSDFDLRKIEPTNHDLIWQQFREEEIGREVIKGKVVLVDVTADWCITCKFNKVRVLHDPEIAILLKRGEVIGMRGDITKPDEVIMEYMKRQNRFAIPFNAVYGPGAPNGLVTSELLSKKELLKLIQQAKGTKN
jgi:suppressor for copper-sensitivity B